MLHALVETAILKTDIDVADNRAARRKRTRLSIFNRIATFIIVFITVGLMLLAIPGVRDIGVTLMASAGLAALAVGAAAQPALKALIAGFQMALTEPVIVGDAVIIGGEWGWIEEIRTTYVVVKVWDERRLVVPTTKFLEEIFQNWTKTTAQLMGTVMLYVDPATRLDPIRDEVHGNRRAQRAVGRPRQAHAGDRPHPRRDRGPLPRHRQGFADPVRPALRRARSADPVAGGGNARSDGPLTPGSRGAARSGRDSGPPSGEALGQMGAES